MSDLLNELRGTATVVCNSTSKFAAASIAEILITESRQASRMGRFSLHIWLQDREWKRADVEAAAIELRNKNLTVTVGNEITAWYSNTDCDTADFIEVSWK